MTIKSTYVCPYCNKNHLKDYGNSGDYDEDGVLLSFCPLCGRMYHISLSQNKRKIIAVKLAMRCNLDFSEAKRVTRSAPENNFLPYIIKSLKIVREDIIAVIEMTKK